MSISFLILFIFLKQIYIHVPTLKMLFLYYSSIAYCEAKRPSLRSKTAAFRF